MHLPRLRQHNSSSQSRSSDTPLASSIAASLKSPGNHTSQTSQQKESSELSPTSSIASSLGSQTSQKNRQTRVTFGEEPSRLTLCLTIYRFRNQDVMPEAYMEFMRKVNGPRLRDLMLKHGIKHWSVTYNLPETLRLTNKIKSDAMDKVAKYDSIAQIHMTSIRQHMALKNDPEFMDHVPRDMVKFADLGRTRMTIGYIQTMIINGKAAGNDGGEEGLA